LTTNIHKAVWRSVYYFGNNVEKWSVFDKVMKLR